MYERRSEPLLPQKLFIRRLLKHSALALLIILVSLGIGMIGYHFIESLNWVDALLNASMILGGMGPVNELHSNSGKIFASICFVFRNCLFGHHRDYICTGSTSLFTSFAFG